MFSVDSVRGRDGNHDDDDESSHGSMPPLEPMNATGSNRAAAAAVGSTSSSSSSSAARRAGNNAKSSNKNDQDIDDDDSSMPPLEDIRRGADQTSGDMEAGDDDDSSMPSLEDIPSSSAHDESVSGAAEAAAVRLQQSAEAVNATGLTKTILEASRAAKERERERMERSMDAATATSAGGGKGKRDRDTSTARTNAAPLFSFASSGNDAAAATTTTVAATAAAAKAPLKFSLGTSTSGTPAATPTGNKSSDPSPFSFATKSGDTSSTPPGSKGSGPRPFSFATGSSGPSNDKEASSSPAFAFSPGSLSSGGKKKEAGKHATPANTKAGGTSSFVFSPTSVASSSSVAVSSPRTSTNVAFQFNSSSGPSTSSAPTTSPYFSTTSRDPSLQAAAKAASASASAGKSSVSAPSGGGGGGASDRRRKNRKKRDAAGNRPRSPPFSTFKVPEEQIPSAKDGDGEKKTAAVPFSFARAQNESATAIIEKVAERAVDDILSTGRSTKGAISSAMAEEGVASLKPTGDDSEQSPNDDTGSGGDEKKLPPRPKRNLTAFFIYSNESRDEVQRHNPDASYGDIAAICSAQFKSLSPEERAKYQELADRDKERYQRELAVWEIERQRIKETPSATLFVANFDPRETSDENLKEHFANYGQIIHLAVKRNLAFVTFMSVAEAKDAKERTSTLDGSTVSVSFAVGRRPDEAKTPLSFYKDERIGAMKKENPGWSATQIDGAMQAQYFCRLTDAERIKYSKLSGEDDRRFAREMATWENENRSLTNVEYCESPASSCDCERCNRMRATSFRIMDLPAGDAFSPSSFPRQNNGAPRRILRARRPNATAETESAASRLAAATAAARARPSNTSTSNISTSAAAAGSTGTSAAPASTSSRLTSASSAQRQRARGNAGRSPRVVVPVSAGNDETNDAAASREESGAAESESEEDNNVDPNTNAFGALAEDSEEEEDQGSNNSSLSDEIVPVPSSDDDDEDDDDEEGFPLRMLQDMLPGGMGARIAAQLMNRGGPGRRRQQLATNIRPDDDGDSVASSDDEDGGATAKCCACYRRGDQNHKWRRLVTLPCCGLGGKENSSSTRFCASCVLKLAVTRPDSASSVGEYHFFEDERDEPPVSHFYKQNRQSDSKRFIECPRCRDILIVKLKNLKTSYAIDDDDDDDSGECDCSECRAERRANREPTEIKTASSISVHRASFKAKAWFVGRKRDNAMILWKAAHLHRSFIPLDALGGGKYRANVLKLVGWGILHKVPGKRNTDIYRINREDQMELVKLVSPDPTTETDEQVSKEFDLFLDLTGDIGQAAWNNIKKFRIDRAVRLLNRFLYLLMYFRRYLPPPPMSLWQEWSVTALNVFNLTLIVQFLLITAVYGGLFFGVGWTVCRGLRNPGKFLRSATRWMYASAFLGIYLAYRVGKLLYYSQYVTLLGFLSPKALIPFKKVLWG